MIAFQVMAAYTALCAALLLVLAGFREWSRARGAPGAHLNAAEHIPIILVLMIVLCRLGGPLPALHLTGVLLVAGRTLHAAAFLGSGTRSPGRVAGQTLTFMAYGSGILGIVMALGARG